MSRSNSDNLLWFAAGAVAGAAIAVLFAPRSGADTRAYLYSGAGRLYSRGGELYDRGRQIAEEAAGLFEEGRRLLENPEDREEPLTNESF